MQQEAVTSLKRKTAGTITVMAVFEITFLYCQTILSEIFAPGQPKHRPIYFLLSAASIPLFHCFFVNATPETFGPAFAATAAPI